MSHKSWERELFNNTPLTADDIVRLKPVFEYFDTDGDGYVTPVSSIQV